MFRVSQRKVRVKKLPFRRFSTQLKIPERADVVVIGEWPIFLKIMLFGLVMVKYF